MKFIYQYKTKDGTQHEGVYRAASRTAVYDELKEGGVKPFNVQLAPGLINRIASFGKRGLAILVLSLAVVALVFGLVSARRNGSYSTHGPMPRHQIYGDPVRMAELERDCFASVFERPGERWLAYYAQPGYAPGQLPDFPDAALAECLDEEIVIEEDDPREVVELKRIVIGMKDELRAYLSNGVGTTRSYAHRLFERTNQEERIRQRVIAELKDSEDSDKLREANESLRMMGIRPVLWGRLEGEKKIKIAH